MLDKGSGTPILFAFQATGICWMVLVIQTCDLSEPDSMLTCHTSTKHFPWYINSPAPPIVLCCRVIINIYVLVPPKYPLTPWWRNFAFSIPFNAKSNGSPTKKSRARTTYIIKLHIYLCVIYGTQKFAVSDRKIECLWYSLVLASKGSVYNRIVDTFLVLVCVLGMFWVNI